METGLDEHLTERMCIVTRAVHDEDGLIRFVRSPDGYAVPDLQRKLPGRGVWVTLSRQQVSEAVKKNLFSRGFPTSHWLKRPGWRWPGTARWRTWCLKT
jgi:predicted RNA-binding protein YlxR (DUF448 family)